MSKGKVYLAEKARFNICNQKSTLYERRVTQAHKTEQATPATCLLKENMAGQHEAPGIFSS